MQAQQLGRLEKVDLRRAWKHEALDFTNWLSLPENLQLLSDEIGIEISFLQTEALVGKFNVDILAEEENTGRKIIIENQLEPTNHDHLGKIITYASGYDAEIIIWIVELAREEHIRAIDWLNEHTDEDINFFLIQLELWKIGDSLNAPKFQLISQPNDWARIIKDSAKQTGLSETKLLQLEFWDKFKEYVDKQKTKLKLRKTWPQHWYDISIGTSEAHISLTMNTKDNLIGCEIYIVKSKQTYNLLYQNKSKIEEELNEQLVWMELLDKKASRVKITKSGSLDKKNEWQNYFEWLLRKAESFHRVFPKYING